MNVHVDYQKALTDPFFDAAKCHRAAIKACITFRRLAYAARREGNMPEYERQMENLTWHRVRAAIWREMANG